jgi:hypothetical protein
MTTKAEQMQHMTTIFSSGDASLFHQAGCHDLAKFSEHRWCRLVNA